MFLSAIKNHFLKSRVIGLSYYIEPTMAQLSKSYLENPDEYFGAIDTKKYNELKFYSKISQTWKINPSYFSEAELLKYEQSVEQMKQFNEFHEFIDQLHDFFWETKSLYIDISRDMTTSNLWGRSEFTSVTYEQRVKEALDKFHTLLEQTKDYPEWQTKIKEEIGGQLHLIYTNISAEHQDFINLFAEFDKPYYFK